MMRRVMQALGSAVIGAALTSGGLLLAVCVFDLFPRNDLEVLARVSVAAAVAGFIGVGAAAGLRALYVAACDCHKDAQPATPGAQPTAGDAEPAADEGP